MCFLGNKEEEEEEDSQAETNLRTLSELFPHHNQAELHDVANVSLTIEDAVAVLVDTPEDTIEEFHGNIMLCIYN